MQREALKVHNESLAPFLLKICNFTVLHFQLIGDIGTVLLYSHMTTTLPLVIGIDII